MNVFACPACNTQQTVSADFAGKQIPCSQCGAQMAIPASVPVAAQVSQPAPASPEKRIVPRRRRRRLIPLIALAVIFIVIGIAFFTNPTEQQFLELKKDKRGLLEKIEDKYLKGGILMEVALEPPEFTYKNRFIYSVGTYTRRSRLNGKAIHIEYIGVFGRWWIQYPIGVSGELTKI